MPLLWRLLVLLFLLARSNVATFWDPLETFIADRNCTFYYNRPDAVLQATMTGNVEIVNCVLGNLTDGTIDYVDNEVQLNIVNEVAETALIYAARTGKFDIATALIQHGANMDIKARGSTALHNAVLSNFPKIVSLLINSGANLNLEDSLGLTPLQRAVEKEYNDITLLLALAGANVTCADVPTFNDFISAAKSARPIDVAIVMCMVGKDVTMLSRQDSLGNTALHYAIKSQSEHISAILIRKNTNLNLMNENGDTVLMLTSKLSDITEDVRRDQSLDTIAADLISNSANLNLQNRKDGKTALMTAITEGQANIAIKIIEAGANLNLKEYSKGYTALHFAAIHGHMSIVKSAIGSNNCDVNIRSKAGNTALMLAALEGQNEVAKYLLSMSVCADTSLKNAEGKSVLNYARFEVPDYEFRTSPVGTRSKGCSWNSTIIKCQCE